MEKNHGHDIQTFFIVLVIFFPWKTEGTPTIELSGENPVGERRRITGITGRCFAQPPTFTWDLVSRDGSTSLSKLEDLGDPTAVSGGSCESESSLFTGFVTISYTNVDRSIYGQTTRLRLAVNSPENFVVSNGTLTFEVKYNLTGSSQYATLKEQFVWTCQIEINPDFNQNFVKFYRYNVSVGRVGKLTDCLFTIEDSRYDLGCVSKTKYTLTIPARNMTIYEQNSSWRCAYFSSDTQYSSVQKQLFIAIDVRILSLEPNDSLITIEEGKQQEVKCIVNSEAFPKPTFEWFIGETQIATTIASNFSSHMIIGNKSYNGKNLQCWASNSNKSQSKSVPLNIEYRPEIAISPSSLYRIIEGQTAVMTCQVRDANPKTGISFTWIKEGNDIFLHYDGNLTIPNIQRGKRGTYQCTATNSIGNSLPARIDVDVQYKPEVSIISSKPYRITEGQTANLTCVVSAANPSTITEWRWIKTDPPNTFLQRGPNFTISNILRGQSGTYRCTATNSIGTSQPATVQVDVQYKPEVRITSSKPYRITEGQTATLSCVVSFANPSTITEWRWTKTDQPNTVLYRGANYTISNIHRDHSGTYRCTATNSIGTSDPATIQVDVLYGPAKVTLFPDFRVINKTENQTVTPITCSAACNPACSFTWTKVGMTAVNSERLDLGELKRSERGNYTCTASNNISSSSTIINVIVNYSPNIKTFQTSNGQTFEEASSFKITCIVDSFPFSHIYIRNTDTGEVKESGGSIESLTYSESSAKCYQTANYSCHSENVYGSASSSIQRIFILCKPRPSTGQFNIKIGIKTGEGLNISTNFIGYPLPQTSWTFKKNFTDGPGSVPGTQKIYSVQLNVSTIQTGLMKENLNREEFGYYVVTATTPGKPSQISTVSYHVIPQRKPNPPYNISVNCKMSRGTALINWEPGFDGGAAQMFLVSYRTRDGIQKNSTEEYLYPNATLINLEDYTEYKIKIIASNIHGETLSEEEKSCETIEYIEESSNTLPMIIGGAVGGLVVAGVVILGIVFIFRRMSESEGKKNDQRKNILNEERETDEDDGLKDNILYVSAGPTDNEKPGVSGTAVYAEVNKKGPTSDNNANVYAEVQRPGKAKNKEIMYSDKTKPKKGIFKKEEKPKQKKDKKLRQKKENSDVYENAEDIAMTSNLENVYSNAAESNGTTSENRGYKNQDGLLYVEVQFDRNQKNEKPVIHGEDEKTDYATVEFPFPPSSDNNKPQDEK